MKREASKKPCRAARLLGAAFFVGSGVALSGCSSSLPELPSLFGAKEEARLPGTRVSVLKSEEGDITSSIEAKGPVTLPPAQTNVSWSQPGGAPSNAPGHLAIAGAVKSVWTASAGEGSSKRSRLIAVPIVYDNKVYTLDSEGNVAATSAANGGSVWRVSLKPEKERGRAGYGGGLAADDGRIYAATGFGTVVALDAGSGRVIWSKVLGIPIRQSPTVAEGRIFVVNSDSQLYALSAQDGSELWTASGLPEGAAILSNASPAVSGNIVIVPYPSGEVAAFDVKTGAPKWSESMGGGDITTSLSGIGMVARPVVDRDTVFAVSRGGRLTATAKDSGERLWAREISASQTPWVAGDMLFVVDVSGKLLALTRKDGKIKWVAALPDSGTWSGPVLAGGKLWLASSKGLLVGVDATTGNIASQSDVGAPVLITPVVANNRLYVLTDKARLIAMN
jgi:outer membrane protein assembly factor BamB